MAELKVDKLSCKLGGKDVVYNASFSLHSGDLCVVLGPNGAGKTTLVRGAMGLIDDISGVATVRGRSTHELDAEARAREIAYLPQQREVAWPVKVRDVVSVGRFSFGTGLGRETDEDRDAIDEALNACDLINLADRSVDTLSGGEMARVHCARALSTRAPLLIADEPNASLDPRHAFELMEIFHRYALEGGGVMVILHDLALAARYANKVIWMKDGRIVAQGSADMMMTEELCADVYGVRTRIQGKHVELLGRM